MEYLLGPKNPTRGKFIFNPAFNYSKKNDLEQLEKDSESILVKKKEEATSAIRNTVTHDAENRGTLPILELTSDKESNVDQELANCNKKFDITSYNRRQVCVTIN